MKKTAVSSYGQSPYGGNLESTPFAPQKISLSDLNGDTPLNATIASLNNLNMNDKQVDYRKELTKLLTKSRGTAYENTLRRFVEVKLREIGRDLEEKKLAASTQNKKLDLMGLSTSKYDSPQRSSIREAIMKLQESNESDTKKKRLEEMSQPLERNKYKVIVAIGHSKNSS
jgi:hypothetical protein